MPRSHLTHGKDPVSIVQEAGWVSGPVWTSAENFAPTGIRSPDFQPVGSRYTDYATQPLYTYKDEFAGTHLQHSVKLT